MAALPQKDNKKACLKNETGFLIKNLAASYSPTAKAVPSALEGLTAVFGMGTGVAPPL